MRMTKEKIENYKNKLEREKLLISRDINDLKKPVDFGDDIDHGEEEADEVEEMSNRLGEENDLQKRLNEIDVALGKIEKGNYGICEICGKEIEDEVLDASPESRLCKECKLKN